MACSTNGGDPVDAESDQSAAADSFVQPIDNGRQDGALPVDATGLPSDRASLRDLALSLDAKSDAEVSPDAASPRLAEFMAAAAAICTEICLGNDDSMSRRACG